MNCQRIQDLISPYLDSRLSGREMLEVQQHLKVCSHCSQEYEMIRQVKWLLRSLQTAEPDHSFGYQLTTRSAQEMTLIRSLRSFTAFTPRPQRGRRLAAALALSCVGILSVASPFAASTVDPIAERGGTSLSTASNLFSFPDLRLTGFVSEPEMILNQVKQRYHKRYAPMPAVAQPPTIQALTPTMPLTQDIYPQYGAPRVTTVDFTH